MQPRDFCFWMRGMLDQLANAHPTESDIRLIDAKLRQAEASIQHMDTIVYGPQGKPMPGTAPGVFGATVVEFPGA